jgi:hypothetical protein
MNIHLDKIMMLFTIMVGAYCLFSIDTIPSRTLVQTTAIVAEYAYGQVSSNEESSSSNSSYFITNSNVAPKKNSTQLENEDSNNAESLKSLSNDALLLKNQYKNKTGFFSNISNIADITTSNEVVAEGSPEVTADFNGDGSDDIAIGVPFEDEEIEDSAIMDYPITHVIASGNDGNTPENVLDNNFGTRWSSLGIGQFITADLGSPQNINDIDFAWYKGNARQYHFVISTSTDGTTFTNRLSRDSSGNTTGSEAYTFPSINAKYVKITVNGNSQNNWASVNELAILGSPHSHTIFDSGAVNVIYGSSKGISAIALTSSDGGANQLWTHSLTSDIEASDAFGSALATGDFNKDGFSDLAIGVPKEDIGTIMDAGAVNVIYGSSTGLTVNGNQTFTQNYESFPHRAEVGDWFGSALATGDFNKDGISDLAIGIPKDDFNTHHGEVMDAGAVDLIYGSLTGLNRTNSEEWTQESPWWIHANWKVAENDDWFGASLTTGDFDNDGFSELVVGSPGEDIGTTQEVGQVDVEYFGKPTQGGIVVQGISQNSPIIEGVINTNDEFGSALATGDFNKDGMSDLAIGVRGDVVGTAGHTGSVNVIYGSSVGLKAFEVSPSNGRDNQIWTQDSPGIEDVAEDGDAFGHSLGTGDFNKDGISDLAIGVPKENIGTADLTGVVNVIYGSSDGLSFTRLSPGNGRDNQIWTQDSPGIEDVAENVDLFGYSLATGDFNKDGISDLAIGVPREDVDTIGNAGAVNVIYGSLRNDLPIGGLSATVPFLGIGRTDQIWTQDIPGIKGFAEDSDQFGASLG